MKIHCLFDKMVSTSELKEHPDNSNSHSKEQIERLAKILEYQGWRYPIKVSKLSGFITSGHGRLAAARLLKLSQVPVNYQGYESKEQEAADLVSDNAIALWAELDLIKINDIFKDLPNFDLDLLGIEDFKIVEPVVAQCDEDEVPEQVPTVSVLGDLYELGEHRLLCGDSTSSDDVLKLMNGTKADLVFTDPPYGVSFVGVKGSMIINGVKAGKDSNEQIKNDELRGEDLEALFKKSIRLAVVNSIDTAPLYIFFGINRSRETLQGIEDSGLVIRNWLIWDKGNVGYHAMGAQYKPNFEAFLYCHHKGSSPSWTGTSDQQTIWRHSSERLGLHPTMKPVALIVQAFGNHHAKNVLDLFGGSGSTLIACEKTNRKCFMAELDPHYVSVIVARWCKYTGRDDVILNGEKISWKELNEKGRNK